MPGEPALGFIADSGSDAVRHGPPRGALAAVALALALALALIPALGSIPSVHAQGGDIRIADLDCSADPERIVIKNFGEQVQDVAGWELQSDPTQTEVLDLSGLVSLEPGESVTIQGERRIELRDNDPSDFVRVVDQTGTTVNEVNCAGVAGEVVASPDASEPGDVPNGGGEPPETDGYTGPPLLILTGGLMAAVGLAAIALPAWGAVRWSLGRSPPATGRNDAAPPGPQPPGRRRSRTGIVALASTSVFLGLAALGLMLWSSRQRHPS